MYITACITACIPSSAKDDDDAACRGEVGGEEAESASAWGTWNNVGEKVL